MPFSRGSFRAERMWGGIDCTWYEVAGRTRTRGFVVRPSLEIELSTGIRAVAPHQPIESGDPRRSQKPAAAVRRSLLSAPRIGAFNRNPSGAPHHPIESGDPRRSQKPAAANRAPFDLKSAQDHRDEIEDQEESAEVGGGCQDGTGGEGRIRLESFQRFVRRAF